MPRYIVTLTNEEIQELKRLVQKGGKGYRIKYAQILLKLDQKINTGHMTVLKMRMELPIVRLQALPKALLQKEWRLHLEEKNRKTADAR